MVLCHMVPARAPSRSALPGSDTLHEGGLASAFYGVTAPDAAQGRAVFDFHGY